MIPKWSPRGAFGSTLGTENDPKAYKIFVLGTSILHTDFRGPAGSHCGRNRLRIRCQKQCLDCPGASGSHIGRFTKNLPGGHDFLRILTSFWLPNRASWVTLAHNDTFFSPLGSVSLSGPCKSSKPSPNSHQARGQSLSIRLGI